MTTPCEPADLVLQGGGVKGIAVAGAVQVLLRRYDIHRVAGTSAGAILASLVAAGYTGDGVREAMASLPYAKVPDAWPPLVGPVAGLALAEGLYRGDVIERWVADRLNTATAVMGVPARGCGSGRRGLGPGVAGATRTSRRCGRGRAAGCG